MYCTRNIVSVICSVSVSVHLYEYLLTLASGATLEGRLGRAVNGAAAARERAGARVRGEARRRSRTVRALQLRAASRFHATTSRIWCVRDAHLIVLCTNTYMSIYKTSLICTVRVYNNFYSFLQSNRMLLAFG